MKRLKLKKIPFIMIVFMVGFLFIFTFNITSSRYFGQIEGNENDIVAIPVLGLDNPSFSYSKDNMLPGYTSESDFYVRNYDDTKQNEVLMRYYLKITLDTIIPLKITLTDENGYEVSLNEGRTNEFELPYNKQIYSKYHLKIEWDESNNSYEYAGKSVKLIVDLIATQVVGDA